MAILLSDSYKVINWDLNTKSLDTKYWGKVTDSGRGCKVALLQNGVLKIPSTETMRVNFKKPSGLQIFLDGVISGNYFVFDFTEQVFAEQGEVMAELMLNVGGEWLMSSTFYIQVDQSFTSAIESSEELTALQTALSDVDEVKNELVNINTELAQIATDVVTNYAKKDEVTNVMTPKGNIAYASLPTTGNTVGWYYYCSDGDGTHGKGNYVWNGTAWYFGGTGDEGYNILNEELSILKTDEYLKQNLINKITESSITEGFIKKAQSIIKGHKYKIVVSKTVSGYVQFGTLNSSAQWVDKTDILYGTLYNKEFVFTASDNAVSLAIYGHIATGVTVDLYELFIVNNVYNDLNNSVVAEYPYGSVVFENISIYKDGTTGIFAGYYTSDYVDIHEFSKIYVESIVTFKSESGTLNICGVAYYDKNKSFISALSSDDVGNKLPISATDTTNSIGYGLFNIPNNAYYVRYSRVEFTDIDRKISHVSYPSIKLYANADKIYDKFEIIEENIKNNACSIYEFLGTKDTVLSADLWNQGNGYISLTHSGDNFIDGVVAHKYVTAFNRVISYDFVPYENSIICGYTQSAGYEYFWRQGYCISVNFSNKTLNIHNKYGADSTTVSTTLPSVYKSVAFSQDVYTGRKFRLVIERTDVRGIKATLYSLTDYSVLAVIVTGFEALTIPTVGLGYDYPSFTVLSGNADLYYLGIKIKNATNCYLYIVGDSLIEGVAIEPDKAWAYMVAKSCQNTVVSGRGGATINSIKYRILDEAAPLKPKYVMVMIGTNSGNTPEKLQELITTIIGIGATPIINCIPCTSTSIQSEVNAQILALNTCHVRMDIATALSYELANGADTSLFLGDGVHLTATGYERMYKRVLIDCPFLFN